MGIYLGGQETRANTIQNVLTFSLFEITGMLLGSCKPQEHFDIQISGSVSHNLQGANYYEGTSADRKLYIQESDPGGDSPVLTISFPVPQIPSNFQLASPSLLAN